MYLLRIQHLKKGAFHSICCVTGPVTEGTNQRGFLDLHTIGHCISRVPDKIYHMLLHLNYYFTTHVPNSDNTVKRPISDAYDCDGYSNVLILP